VAGRDAGSATGLSDAPEPAVGKADSHAAQTETAAGTLGDVTPAETVDGIRVLVPDVARTAKADVKAGEIRSGAMAGHLAAAHAAAEMIAAHHADSATEQALLPTRASGLRRSTPVLEFVPSLPCPRNSSGPDILGFFFASFAPFALKSF
jgi:hypothetical protein